MSKKLLFLISFVLVLALAGNALAPPPVKVMWDNDSGAGDRLWQTATNWDIDAVPGAGDLAYISDQYTDDANGPIIQAGIDAACESLYMGWQGTYPLPTDGDAVLTMTGGTLTADTEIEIIAADYGAAVVYPDGNAVFDMNGGTVSATWFTLGSRGAGYATFNMDGGVVDVCDGFWIGWWGAFAGKTLYSTLNMSDGEINITGTGNLELGSYSRTEATINMTGGVINVGGWCWLSFDEDIFGQPGHGTINMSAGDINVAGYLLVGAEWDSVGDINMTGGAIDVNQWLEVGGWSVGRIATGHIALHGGTITANLFCMGGGGVGTMDLAYDGTMIVDGDYRVPNGWLFDPCSDTPCSDDEDETWGTYTGTIAKLTKLGLITAYNTNVGDIITDGNYPAKVGLRAVVNLDYDVTNPGKTTITAGADDPNLAWDPDPLFGSGGLLPPDVLSWAAGDNAASHDVYFGTSFDDVNDANTTVTLGVYKGNQALADVNYSASTTWGTTYYWRIDEVNAATTWKGTVWNFATVPAWATNPYPTDNALYLQPFVVLSWDPGPEAVTHDVYFGTNWDDVNDATTTVDPNNVYKGEQVYGANTYDTGTLEDLQFDTYYYWRIDEVNLGADVTCWKGDVWTFWVDYYLAVDDFDSYVDKDALRAVWTTGHLTNNGAELFVASDPNRTYHGPGQSMMYYFRNFNKSQNKYVGSEAKASTADLQSGSDWTVGGGGARALVLHFYGNEDNLDDTTGVVGGIHQDQMYVAVEDGSANVGIVKWPDMNNIKEDWWHEWDIDLKDPCLTDVNLANVVTMYIGFGGQKMGQTEEGAGRLVGGDTVWFDDIQLWPPWCRTEFVPTDFTNDCKTDINDLEIMSADWLAYDYNFIAALPSEANLIGWWKFDEGSGTITVDSSGYGNDGTITDASWTIGYPNDPCNSGLDFAGDGVVTFDRVVCAVRDGNNPGTYPAELMPDTFTIACWVKLNSFPYFGTFVSNGYDVFDECGFYLYDYGWIGVNGQDFGLAIRTEPLSGDAMTYVETASIYKTNTWYHLAATYDDANNVSIYVDASLAAGPTDVGGPIRWVSSGSNSYPPDFKIGVLYYPDTGYGYYFADSAIDDVRYYDYALTQGEISVLAGLVTPGVEYYQPVPSIANITDPEPKLSRKVNFHDYRILADHWLEEPVLWPSP